MSVKGGDAVKAKLRELAAKYPDAAKKGIFKIANLILAESMRRTPVDTGRLRASGYVKEPTVDGGKIEERIGFGASYALAVHEKTEVSHPTGQAKFLSSVIDDHRHSLPAELAESIKEDVK